MPLCYCGRRQAHFAKHFRAHLAVPHGPKCLRSWRRLRDLSRVSTASMRVRDPGGKGRHTLAFADGAWLAFGGMVTQKVHWG